MGVAMTELRFTVTSVSREWARDCQCAVVTLVGADGLVQARLELEGEGIGPFHVGETYTQVALMRQARIASGYGANTEAILVPMDECTVGLDSHGGG